MVAFFVCAFVVLSYTTMFARFTCFLLLFCLIIQVGYEERHIYIGNVATEVFVGHREI